MRRTEIIKSFLLKINPRNKEVSFSFFIFLFIFIFGAFLPCCVAQAASIIWTGGASGTWETGANWSGGAVPTSADQVTINGATVTLSSGQTANFGSLTIATSSATELILTGNIGIGGNITVANLGILTQNNTTLQTVTNTLTIQSGGTLRHSANSSAQSFIVNFSANTIDIESGGSINVDGRGYTNPGTSASAGRGPGGGGPGSGTAGGGGGGHGGNGGNGTNAAGVGGTAYCDITNPSTIGSSGGQGTSSNAAGAGGGLIIINATGTLTIDGTISAKGNDRITTYGGGGSGGGIKLTANTITGTPTLFTVAGGSGVNSTGGGGGGGCVLLSYTTTNSISSSTVVLSGGAGGLPMLIHNVGERAYCLLSKLEQMAHFIHGILLMMRELLRKPLRL